MKALFVLAALLVAVGSLGISPPDAATVRAGVEAISKTGSGATEAAFFRCASGAVTDVVVGSPARRGVNPWDTKPACNGWLALIHTHPTTGEPGLSGADQRIPRVMDVEFICALSLTGQATCAGGFPTDGD